MIGLIFLIVWLIAILSLTPCFIFINSLNPIWEILIPCFGVLGIPSFLIGMVLLISIPGSRQQSKIDVINIRSEIIKTQEENREFRIKFHRYNNRLIEQWREKNKSWLKGRWWNHPSTRYLTKC